MIDTSRPFSLYALCSITYDGRAFSTLERGRYLILYKKDGSFLIHGADLCKPRNYQGSGSKLEYRDEKLISTNKKETITVEIQEILEYSELDEWSESQIVISRTEKELSDKIFNNWHDYFDGDFFKIQQEYRTDVGNIDVLGITMNGVYYVVEVKRRKASIPDCSQLKRYVDVLRDASKTAYGFLASPEIGDNALKCLEKYGFKWVEVNF